VEVGLHKRQVSQYLLLKGVVSGTDLPLFANAFRLQYAMMFPITVAIRHASPKIMAMMSVFWRAAGMLEWRSELENVLTHLDSRTRISSVSAAIFRMGA